MIKYRDHRGGLEASMETAQEFETPKELRKYLEDTYMLPKGTQLKIQHHSFDKRCGWDTHIVIAKNGVLGFTDGPVTL